MIVPEESQKIIGKASKNFTHAFYLITTTRTYELFASSEEERKMWVTAFQFISICAKVDIAKILSNL